MNIRYWAGLVFAVGLVVIGVACGSGHEDLGKLTQHYWTGWGELSSTDYGSLRPAVAKNSAGGFDVFWTDDADGNIRVRHYDSVGWTPVTTLAAPAGGTQSGPAVAERNAEQNIVVKGAGGYFYNWRTGNGAWSFWQNLGTPPSPGIDAPGISTRPSTNEVQVWVQGTDHKLYVKTWTPPNWSAWTKVDDQVVVYSSPSAVELQPNVTYIAVRGPSTGGLAGKVLLRKIHNGVPAAWQDMGGGGITSDGPVVTTRAGNRLDLWSKWNTGEVYHQWWVQGIGWSGWGVGAGAPPGALNTEGVLDTGSQQVIATSVGVGKIFYRRWIDDPENPGPSTYKTVNLPTSFVATWEDTALAVPPNTAGCGPNGGMIFSLGRGETVWRGDLSCFTSGGGGTCAAVTQAVYGDAAVWPSLSLGYIDSGAYGLHGSNDNQIVRLSDGSLLLAHLGVRRDLNTAGSCNDPVSPGKGTCRGTLYFFTSIDCGKTWTFLSVLDPKLISNGRYYNTSAQHGFDRPELYVDPYTTTNGKHPMYVTVHGDGNTTQVDVLFSSTDNGLNWVVAGEMPRGGAHYMTSVPGGRLYIFGSYDDDGTVPYDAVLSWYDPSLGPNAGLSAQVNIPGGSEDLDILLSPGLSTDSQGIARVGHLTDGDYIRVHYPHLESNGTQSLRFKTLKIANDNTLSLATSDTIKAVAAAGSVVAASTIEPARLELAPEVDTDVSLLYWYETTQTETNKNMQFGNMTTKYRLYRGLTASATYSLPYNADGTPHTWSSFSEFPGDYQKGASYFDVTTGKVVFIPQWAEFDPNPHINTNVVSGYP